MKLFKISVPKNSAIHSVLLLSVLSIAIMTPAHFLSASTITKYPLRSVSKIEALEDFSVITPENAANLKLLTTLELKCPPVFSNDSKLLVLGLDSGIIICNLDSSGLSTFLKSSGKPGFMPFCLSPGSKYLAWRPNDSIVQVWDMDNDTVLCDISIDGFIGWGKGFSPDNSFLTVRDRHGIKIWDIQSGKKILDLELGANREIHISPDWKLYALEMWDNPIRVELIDILSQEKVKTLSGFSTAAPVWGVAFSPDWRTVAWKSRTVIKLMDVATGTFGADITPYSNAVFSPDGNILAGAESGWVYDKPYFGKVVLFDIAGGDTLAILEHSSHIRNIIFSPDGKLVVTSTEDGIVTLWDWAKGEKLHSLNRGDDEYSDLQFSPSGRLLILRLKNGYAVWGIDL